MQNCGVSRLTIALLLLVAVLFGSVQASYAANVNLTLTRVASLISIPDAAGSTLVESGTVSSGAIVVGRFVRTIRVVTGVTDAQNTGIVTITLLGLGPAPPLNVTLHGSHSFSSGDDVGGIGAASIPGLTGNLWSLQAGGSGVSTLTLFLP